MNWEFIFTSLATLIALGFASLVFVQFLSRHKPYQLIWAVALLMFALATGSEALAAWRGWNVPLYKSWYMFGALFGVAYLGLGSLWLQASRRASLVVTVILVLFSLIAVGDVLVVPVNLSAAFAEGGRITAAGFPTSTRLIFTPVLNTFGTILLVGGALYSAWRFTRNRGLGRRVLGLVLLALGALIVAAGSLLERFGVPQPFSAALLLGIAVMASGFSIGLR